MRSDVCLLLEGTYPYVAGGVSTWVKQLLDAMPQLRFSILFIGANAHQPREAKYEIPPHVVELREVFVHDYPTPGKRCCHPLRLSKEEWQIIEETQMAMAQGEAFPIDKIAPIVRRWKTPEEVLAILDQSRESWEIRVKQYEALGNQGLSFLHYFWTHRFIHIPPLQLLRADLPYARIYHAACTGYAGMLGALAHALTGAPFLLTEHGIYTRERRIEIFHSEWIHESDTEGFLDLSRTQSYFKRWWTNLFLSLSRVAYQAADRIFCLFEKNRQLQIRDGAPASRTAIIPNGIDTERFVKIPLRERSRSEPFQIGFVGRVCAIKDVKTLLRALAILKARSIAFHAHILGPLDEEKDYVEECRALTGALELEKFVTYHGRVNVLSFLPRLDVIVLTSISEGMPFVILEGNCAGLPVVTTDVGACREMVEGRLPEDRKLGPSGIVTPVASPAATAAALEKIARNPTLQLQMGRTGRQRVLNYYDIRDVMNQYLSEYERYLFAGRVSEIPPAPGEDAA